MNERMSFSEIEILKQLDLAFNQTPSEYFPNGQPRDVKDNLFLDLEHGYFETAGSRIHLYADSINWAIVFEKSGYHNRGFFGEIELTYIGNCVEYPIIKYPKYNYISNRNRIILIDHKEFERIRSRQGEKMETFELIDRDIQEIKIRNQFVSFENNHESFEKVGVEIRDYDNPNKLVGFADLIRFLHETNPAIISATDSDMRKHIPSDIPRLMTIDDFHFASVYEQSNLPSTQEMYRLIAKILSTRNPLNWVPNKKANNSWKNWESGHL